MRRITYGAGKTALGRLANRGGTRPSSASGTRTRDGPPTILVTAGRTRPDAVPDRRGRVQHPIQQAGQFRRRRGSHQGVGAHQRPPLLGRATEPYENPREAAGQSVLTFAYGRLGRIERGGVRAIPRDLRPHGPALMVAFHTSSFRQPPYQQQPTAMLAVWVLDDPWFGRATSVGHGHPDDGLRVCDLHGERATASAGRMQHRVVAELGSDTDHVVPRRAVRQQRDQPLPYLPYLPRVSAEGSPPAQSARGQRWPGYLVTPFAVRTVRVLDVRVASHGQDFLRAGLGRCSGALTQGSVCDAAAFRPERQSGQVHRPGSTSRPAPARWRNGHGA